MPEHTTEDDRAARLTRCVRDCARPAWGLAYAVLGRGADADEVVQDAFVIAARKWQDIPTENQWPWFATVVTNVARNARRKRATRERLAAPSADAADEVADSSAGVDPLAIVEALERVRLVRAAVDALPDGEREAITHTYFAGMTQADAAEALGVPLSTLKFRVRSALERLRGKLRVASPALLAALALHAAPEPAHGFAVAQAAWLATATQHLPVDAAAASAPTAATTVRSATTTARGTTTVAATTALIAGGLIMKKLAVAALVLIIAGLAWLDPAGWFDPTEAPAPPTPIAEAPARRIPA